jgi:hypothetical protein
MMIAGPQAEIHPPKRKRLGRRQRFILDQLKNLGPGEGLALTYLAWAYARSRNMDFTWKLVDKFRSVVKDLEQGGHVATEKRRIIADPHDDGVPVYPWPRWKHALVVQRRRFSGDEYFSWLESYLEDCGLSPDEVEAQEPFDQLEYGVLDFSSITLRLRSPATPSRFER